MNRAAPVIGVLGIGIVVALVFFARGAFDRDKAPAPNASSSVAATPPGAMQASLGSQPSSADDEGLPPEVRRKYPPGTFVPFTLPKVKSGILCPDGSYLPLLNGVPYAPGISREAWLGPPGPVVGKKVDQDGIEWWIHQDGSSTTTRFKDTFDGSGKLIPNIETMHAAKMPDKSALPGPDVPIKKDPIPVK